MTQAKPLIEGLPFEVVIADNGDDSQAVVAVVENQGGEAVVPSRSIAKSPRKTDGARDKDRNLVEGETLPTSGDSVREKGPKLPRLRSRRLPHDPTPIAEKITLNNQCPHDLGVI